VKITAFYYLIAAIVSFFVPYLLWARNIIPQYNEAAGLGLMFQIILIIQSYKTNKKMIAKEQRDVPNLIAYNGNHPQGN